MIPIPYPVTPYLFEIDTLSGAVLLEMEPARYEDDEPAQIRLTPILAGYDRPLQDLKEYFKSYGFGMHGKPVDLDMAAPADIHHILIMSQAYYQGKQNLIRSFQVLRGFIPPEGFADLSPEAEDDNPVLESTPIMEGSTGPKTIKDWLKKIAKTKDRGKKTDLWYDFLDSGGDVNKLLQELVLSLPAGSYKLHSSKYGTDITDTIHDIYGTMPSRLITEPLLLGLQAIKPNKVYASFTHDMDAIEIYPAGGKKRSITESAAIDREANKAATSPKNDLPAPSDAQKETGNYVKGHVSIQGLQIAIENPAGSERSGIGPDGKRWTSKLNHHYGYIKGTKGRDKDHIDIFLGPDPEGAETVFVVNQVDRSGKFDEHKVMIGFAGEPEARKAYLSNYEKGWQGLGSIVAISMDGFKAWLEDGDTMKAMKKGFIGESAGVNSWIGVDLDGTLARYDGWKGYEHIGEPVPLMMDIVKEHIAQGETVKIFTARAADPVGIPPVEAWLEKNGLKGLEVTNKKDDGMSMLYDDRAAKVIVNTGVVLEGAKGTGWKFPGGKLVKQKGCSTDAKGCQMHYIRQIAYGSTGNIVEETYSDDYGFGIQAKTLKELKKKMAEHGESSITESAEDAGWRTAVESAKSFDDLSAAFTKVFPIAAETTAKQKEPWEMTSKEYGESIGSLSFPQTFGMHLPIIIDALKTGKLSHEEYARLYEKDYGDLEEMTGQKRKEPQSETHQSFQRTTPAKGTPEREELDKQIEDHKAKLDAAYDAMDDAEQARNRASYSKRDAAQRKVDKLQSAYNELLHSPIQDQGKIARWEDVAETGDELQRIEARRLLKVVSDKDGAAMKAELFTERLAKRGLSGDTLIEAVNIALLHSFTMSDGLNKTLEIAEAKQQAPALQADYRQKIDSLDIHESDKARFKKEVDISIWPEYMDKAYKEALKLEESVGPGIRGKREAEEIIRQEEKERRAALEAAKIKLSDMADKPDPKKFYSRMSNGELQEVKGHNLKTFAGIDLFTNKDAYGNWAVTEGKSGVALARDHSTQKEAIESARALIEQRGGVAAVNKMALNLAKEHGLSPRWAKDTEAESPENAPATIESDNGPTTINRLLSRISGAKERKQKDELYLSVYGNDRKRLLETAILRLKPGTYTLAMEGRAAPSLQSTIESLYGLNAGLDANERFIRGMATKYPKAIMASFTLGLQEITINENASRTEVWD